jgi:hypothetical protein
MGNEFVTLFKFLDAKGAKARASAHFWGRLVK